MFWSLARLGAMVFEYTSDGFEDYAVSMRKLFMHIIPRLKIVIDQCLWYTFFLGDCVEGKF